MSRYKPKEGPVIPVVGGDLPNVGSGREEQMRKWEEEAARKREADAKAAVAAAAVPAVPAPSASPEPNTASDAPAADEPEDSTGSSSLPATTDAPLYLPMPEFVEPDTADPAERLEYYSRGILAAEYAARANHERANQQKLIAQGLRLRAIKGEELHKTAGYDTFGDLVDARFGIKKHQANNIIRCLGVVQALEHVTTQELKERPLRPLVPILDKHGPEAVRETWQEAARHGNVTENSLRDAANFLGYGLPKELPAGGAANEKSTPEKRNDLGESAAVVQRIRSLAEKDPERARREAEELQRAVEALVEELSAPQA